MLFNKDRTEIKNNTNSKWLANKDPKWMKIEGQEILKIHLITLLFFRHLHLFPFPSIGFTFKFFLYMKKKHFN